jgi:serine protease Do
MSKIYTYLLTALFLIAGIGNLPAQDFDFSLLENQVKDYTVIIDLKIEISFGIHNTEQTDQYLGTIVTSDGMVIFDGTSLSSDGGLSSMTGFTVKTSPVKIEIKTLDGKTYDGEYIGVDRFTSIGFVKIISDGEKFTPVDFKSDQEYKVGDWLGLYMLLPEFISPSLAADIGMVSALIKSPEEFVLTVGFNPLQKTSVLFNGKLEPVGVLGTLMDPTTASTDAGGLLDSYNQFGVPLLGVISAERLSTLIASPPQKGEIDRGWLGITLQALTKEIAEFWNLDIAGGIIVNDIVKNSPADKAGLLVGDIIFEVNGQPVEVDKEEKLPVFQRMVSEMGPDVAVELAVVRRDDTKVDTLSLLATLEEAPMAAVDAPEYENKTLEFKVRDMVFADYMITNLDPEEFTGVVVSELKMGGLADIGGLNLGDIIQRIGDVEVGSIEDAETAMTNLEVIHPDEIIFFIWRNNQTMFVNVKTE